MTLKYPASGTPGRPELTYRLYEWGDQYTIRGTITGWDKRFKYVWLGASRPDLFAATLFREICEKSGIEITGVIRKGDAPEKGKELVVMESVPLWRAVEVMNQESNNVIAEMLNKNLGAVFHSVPGTRAKGISVVSNFLIRELDFTVEEFSIGDASGLSTNNRFTAENFTKALNFFYRDAAVRETFLPTLARQGHHPHAMVPVPPEEIKMYVKTGTLSVRGVNTVVRLYHS